MIGKLLPFYVGIVLGYMVNLDPDLAMFYGGLAGLLIGIILLQHKEE